MKILLNPRVILRALAIVCLGLVCAPLFVVFVYVGEVMSEPDGVMYMPNVVYTYFGAFLAASMTICAVAQDSTSKDASWSIREVFVAWRLRHPMPELVIWLYFWVVTFVVHLYAVWHNIDSLFGIGNRVIGGIVGIVIGYGVISGWERILEVRANRHSVNTPNGGTQ